MTRRFTYGGVFAGTLIAAMAAACLSSAGLAAWADGLPDSAAARLASTMTHSLDGAMTQLGVNRPGITLQTTVRRVEAAKF